jgi:hypothetical protein
MIANGMLCLVIPVICQVFAIAFWYVPFPIQITTEDICPNVGVYICHINHALESIFPLQDALECVTHTCAVLPKFPL